VVRVGLYLRLCLTRWTQDADHGLDGMAKKRLKEFEFPELIVNNTLCVDVKSDINMNKFSFWERRGLINLDNNLFLSNLHQSELDQIELIIKRNRS